MARICPSCKIEIAQDGRKTSAWIPILTAVGVSAAAYFVYRQVKRSRDGGMDSILDHCARAATALDKRIGDGFMQIAS